MVTEERRISKCKAEFPEVFSFLFLMPLSLLFLNISWAFCLSHTERERSFSGGQSILQTLPQQQPIRTATSWPPRFCWLSKFVTETGVGRACGRSSHTPLGLQQSSTVRTAPALASCPLLKGASCFLMHMVP